LIVGQLNGGTTKSAASGPRAAVPADMKSSKIIWQADENGDWQEFDFDNASDCKALVGPIFGEGTVVNENEAMRVLARIVVVYKGGRQETVELLDPFGLVRRNRIVRRGGPERTAASHPG
jgi:hypothetical protein